MLRDEDIRVLRVFHEATRWEKGGEVVLRCGAETGRVFFAGGKIAWAAVSTIKRTFTEYVVEHSDLGKEEAKEAFEDCKRTGKNFGETVVEWGLLGEAALRLLLIQHISECLLEIFSWSAVEAMFLPEEKTYKGSLTFDFEEVLQAVTILDTEGKLPFGGLKAGEILVELEKQPKDKKKSVVVETIEDRALTEKILAELGEHPEKYQQEPVSAPEYEEEGLVLPVRKGKGKLVALVVLLLLLTAGGAAYYLRDRLFPEKKEPAEPVATAVTSPDISKPGEAEAVVDAMEQPSDGKAEGGEAAAEKGEGEKTAEEGAEEKKTQEEEPEKKDEPEQPAGIVAEAEGEGRGSIRVVSKPHKAPIYLDGIYIGHRTPHTLRNVPAGLEHVILIEKRGRRPAFKKLNLEKGQKAVVKLYLRKKGKRWRGRAQVHVDSEPQGAGVYVDGRSVKKRTPADIKLRLGSASKLELRHRGYRKWRRTVRPIPNVELTFFAKLRKSR